MACHLASLTMMRPAEPGLTAFRGPGFTRWKSLLHVCATGLAIGLGLFSAVDTAKSVEMGASTRQAQQQTKDLAKMLALPKVESTQPMLLQADEMVYDNVNNRVTARGNVEIYYGDYTLLADQVIYDRNANTLTATGNVSIKDPSGAIISANHMTLTDDFRDGFVDALKTVTQEDTRIVATSATREAGNVTVFQNGWFTPCKPCEDNPNKAPSWNIRAKKIIHRTDEATITFRNAFFDFFGVPIIWVPYFQMADPTVKRKSGFLMPSYMQSTTLGTAVTVPYYFALSDHYDFTFAPMYTSQAGTLLQGSWRQQLASGAYRVDLAGVFDDGTFQSGVDSDFRGSFVTQGKFDLNPYWSWGWDAVGQSDDTFRRFYLLDPEDKTDEVSQLYLEGLHDRNYFSARFYQTSNLLPTQDPLADAMVYPIIDYDYIVNNPIIGGELSFNSNVMALNNADGTDSNRAILEANWRKQLIDPIGEVFTPFAGLRGDLYDISAFTDPQTNLESSGALVRGNALIGGEYRYPFIATTGSVTHVIEPIAQIIGRPDSVGNQSLIPNEDAESLVFDDTILFDIDKFSGYDRIETGTRANVGFRYTAQLPSGAYARAVFGQSYQIAGENSFAINSGLGTPSSDYVTGLYLQAAKYLSFTAQTRFNHDTLAMERTDLNSQTTFGPVSLTVNYADIAPDAVPIELTSANTINTSSGPELVAEAEGDLVSTTSSSTTTTPQRLEEIQSNGTLSITDRWALLGGLRYDIQNEIFIQDHIGVRYQDDCLTLGVTYYQNNIDVPGTDLKPNEAVMVNLALKYLGSYQFGTSVTGLTP